MQYQAIVVALYVNNTKHILWLKCSLSNQIAVRFTYYMDVLIEIERIYWGFYKLCIVPVLLQKTLMVFVYILDIYVEFLVTYWHILYEKLQKKTKVKNYILRW
jgi:hypothetical protein